jgi:aminopeptidase
LVEFGACRGVWFHRAGSRLYLGEFGVGTNRGIYRSTKKTLFDEKVAGTIHLAIGKAYEEYGVNKSAVHWDMIKTMKPGEILMEGECIQKDEKFSWE